jgi:hypothetical protein
MPRKYGEGNITSAGYIRVRVNGKLIMQHRHIWKISKGEIPNGSEIHHINGNKQDNRLCNLQLVNRETHRRLHEGWILDNGIWYKCCPDCHQLLEVNQDNWYFTTHRNKSVRKGIILFGHCRNCHIKRVCNARETKNLKVGSFTHSA